MRRTLSKLLLIFILATSAAGMSIPANAWWHHYHYRHCQWVPAHYGPGGGFHPAHRRCWVS